MAIFACSMSFSLQTGNGMVGEKQPVSDAQLEAREGQRTGEEDDH